MDDTFYINVKILVCIQIGRYGPVCRLELYALVETDLLENEFDMLLVVL